MTEMTLTINKMCEVYSVTPRTLRFYESKELLFPIRKGQKRLFTKRDQVRLKLILRGKRFGFSLEEIRQLLNLYDSPETRDTQCLRLYELAKIRLNEMKEKRDDLIKVIDELERQIEWGRQQLQSLKEEKKKSPPQLVTHK